MYGEGVGLKKSNFLLLYLEGVGLMKSNFLLASGSSELGGGVGLMKSPLQLPACCTS